MHAGELKVHAADDVLAGAGYRHAAFAALVLLDGLDNGAQQPLVRLSRLGETAPERAALPQRRQAQQVQERGA